MVKGISSHRAKIEVEKCYLCQIQVVNLSCYCQGKSNVITFVTGCSTDITSYDNNFRTPITVEDYGKPSPLLKHGAYFIFLPFSSRGYILTAITRMIKAIYTKDPSESND